MSFQRSYFGHLSLKYFAPLPCLQSVEQGSKSNSLTVFQQDVKIIMVFLYLFSVVNLCHFYFVLRIIEIKKYSKIRRPLLSLSCICFHREWRYLKANMPLLYSTCSFTTKCYGILLKKFGTAARKLNNKIPLSKNPTIG